MVFFFLETFNKKITNIKYFKFRLVKFNILLFLQLIMLCNFSNIDIWKSNFFTKTHYVYLLNLLHLLFSRKFTKSFDFLKSPIFFEKELSINVRPFYVKKFWNKYFKKKKLRYKKWPRLVKRFLRKKLKRKYRFVLLNFKNKFKKLNYSSHLLYFLNLIKKINLPIKPVSRIFFKNIPVLMDRIFPDIFFKSKFIFFNHYCISKQHVQYLFKYVPFTIKHKCINLKKIKNNRILSLIKFKKKKFSFLSNVKNITPKLIPYIKYSDLFLFKNIIFMKKYKCLKNCVYKETFSKSVIHKNPFFLKKFIYNEIIRFDLFKSNKNLLFLSNNVLHFFFYKNIMFSKLGLLKFQGKLEKYNNYLPLIYIHKPLRRLIFKKFQKSYTPDFFKYFYLYLFSYLEYLLKSKVYCKIQSRVRVNLESKIVLHKIFLKHKNFQSRIGRGFFFFEMLEILWLSFFYKDLNFLISWFIKTIERIPFKRHKKLLSVMKFIITKYPAELLSSNNVKGFFFDIRGKVGVSGNAKKRHFSFYSGKYSKTTKNSKFEYQHNIVRTFTGAMGVTFILYY